MLDGAPKTDESAAESNPKCPGCDGRNAPQSPTCGWCGLPLLHDRRRVSRRASVLAVAVLLGLALAGWVSLSLQSGFPHR